MEAFQLAFHKEVRLIDTSRQICHDHFFSTSLGRDMRLIHKRILLLNYLALPLSTNRNQLAAHDLKHRGPRYQVLGL